MSFSLGNKELVFSLGNKKLVVSLKDRVGCLSRKHRVSCLSKGHRVSCISKGQRVHCLSKGQRVSCLSRREQGVKMRVFILTAVMTGMHCLGGNTHFSAGSPERVSTLNIRWLPVCSLTHSSPQPERERRAGDADIDLWTYGLRNNFNLI